MGKYYLRDNNYVSYGYYSFENPRFFFYDKNGEKDDTHASPFTARDGDAFGILYFSDSGEAKGMVYAPVEKIQMIDGKGIVFNDFEEARRDAISRLEPIEITLRPEVMEKVLEAVPPKVREILFENARKSFSLVAFNAPKAKKPAKKNAPKM